MGECLVSSLILLLKLESFALSSSSDAALCDVQLNRKRGMEARKNYMKPVGAWFSVVGRLHEVHHLWHYKCVSSFIMPPDAPVGLDRDVFATLRDLATREEKRENAWELNGWNDTVARVCAYFCRTALARDVDVDAQRHCLF